MKRLLLILTTVTTVLLLLTSCSGDWYDIQGQVPNQGQVPDVITGSFGGYMPISQFTPALLGQKAYSDQGRHCNCNATWFGSNSQMDGIGDFWVSKGTWITEILVGVDTDGDGRRNPFNTATESGGIQMNLYATLEYSIAYSLVYKTGENMVYTVNGVPCYYVTILTYSSPIAYQGSPDINGYFSPSGVRYYASANL